jgi:WD40 repeat protein
MAPERFNGQSDPRSDVYSLGATLYELLTLRPAFEGSDRHDLMKQILMDSPPGPRQLDRRIPRDVETIVLKAMAKDPAHRFATAAAMAEELRRFVDGLPIRSRSLSTTERCWRWCKRNPMIASLNALAATLTIAIAVIMSVAAHHNGRLVERLQASIINERASSLEAKKTLIQASLSEAEARSQSRRGGQRFEALRAIDRAMRLVPVVGIGHEDRLRLRNEAIAAMALPDLHIDRELNVPNSVTNGFAVDSAFERYATKLDDGTVVVCGLADGAERLRLAGLPPCQTHGRIAFSPDGRYLGATTDNRSTSSLQVWDLDACREVGLFENVFVPAWAFHPGGRQVAVGRSDSSVSVLELPLGREIYCLRPGIGALGSIAFSKDGANLAFAPWLGTEIHVVESASGRAIMRVQNPGGVFHLAWSPYDRNLLAAGSENNRIHIWNVESHSRTKDLSVPSAGLVVAFHPGGELLACRGWNRMLTLLDIRTGRSIFSRASDWSWTLQFDPTGRWLSVDPTEEKARILEVSIAPECRRFVREPFSEVDGYGALSIDPTGRRLMTVGSDLTFWDLSTGATLRRLGLGSMHRIPVDSTGAVLTSLPFLLRWPVHEAPAGETTIGPPRLLSRRGNSERAATSRDGRVVAVAMVNEGALLVDAGNPGIDRWLRPHRDVRFVAVSPDGRWVVTGSNGGDGLRLWETSTGRLVHRFPGVPPNIGVVGSFSPDGRQLAINWDGWVLFDTSTWAPKPRLRRGLCGTLAFAPDSRTVAFDDAAGSIILAETESGRELARFADPEQVRARVIAFSPDSSYLVSSLDDRPYLRVWDLRAIRRRLAEIALDWESPWDQETRDAVPPAAQIPQHVRVDRGDLDKWIAELGVAQAHYDRGEAFANSGRWNEAVAEFAEAVRLSPNQYPYWYHLEVAQFAAGREDYRKTCEAMVVQLAKVAGGELSAGDFYAFVWAPPSVSDIPTLIRLAGIDLDHLAGDSRIRGPILYRAGRFELAARKLEEWADTHPPKAWDLLFAAMTYHRLGRSTEAQHALDEASRWIEQADGKVPGGTQVPWVGWYERLEVHTLLREATALMGSPTEEGRR